jgi:hypothetical protein
MLDRAESEPKQRVVAQLLQDAEGKLRQIPSHQLPPKPHRLDVA